MKEYQMKMSIIPDAQGILERCINIGTDPADIYQELTTLLKEVSQEVAQVGDERHITTIMLALEDMADQLRKFTRKQSAIRFYYYGMFQAWSDILREQEMEGQDERQLRTVIDRKRTREIINHLYRHGNVQHKELVDAISIRASNLSTEIKVMSDMGLVRQRKMGKYVYYNLTPKGFRAYERYIVNAPSSVIKKEAQEDAYEAPVLYPVKEVNEQQNYLLIAEDLGPKAEKAGSIKTCTYFSGLKPEINFRRNSNYRPFKIEGGKVKC